MVRRSWMVLVLVLLLIVPTGLASEDDCALFYRNNCSVPDFQARVENSRAQLARYYGNLNLALGDTYDERRFPAAFFFFSEGMSSSTMEGNNILTKAFEFSDTPALVDQLYLAWIAAAFDTVLDTGHATAIPNKVDALYPEGSGDHDYFLSLTTHWLLDGSNENALKSFMQQRGDLGWSSEGSANDLADIIVALAAIYDQADKDGSRTSKDLHLLAEMNLDILFARFAALEIGGQLSGTHVGYYPEKETYDAREGPWYGWSKLYFGETNDIDENTPIREAGLLYTRYCIPDAVRGVNLYRHNAPTAEEQTAILREILPATNQARHFAYVTPEWSLSTVIEANTTGDARPFAHNKGYLSKLNVRYADDPASFFMFNRLTCPLKGEGEESAASDAMRIFAKDSVNDGDNDEFVILGKFGQDGCAEPHLFIGNGFTVTMAENTDVLLLQHADDENWVLRILGDFVWAPVGGDGGRYKPLSKHIPETMNTLQLVIERASGDSDELNGYSQGIAIIPADSSGAYFTLERVPDDFTTDSEDTLYDSVVLNTGATKANGELTYTSKLSGSTTQQYHFKASERYASHNTHGTYSLRNIKSLPVDGSTWNYLQRVDDTWKINGRLPSVARWLTLQFAGTPTKTPSNTNAYGCVDPLDQGGDPSGGDVTLGNHEERLAFLAASLTQKQTGDFTLDCGAIEDVLPEYDPLYQEAGGEQLIPYACVLQRGSGATIGLVVNPNYISVFDGPFAETIYRVSESQPYVSTSEDAPEPPDMTICDDHTGETEDFTFAPCDSFEGRGEPINVWISAPSNTMIFSDDTDPFAEYSALGDIIVFFKSLFGGVWGDPADPSETGAFTGAFFSNTTGSSKTLQIRATRNGNEAELLFKNFGIDMAPLVDRFASQMTVRKAGTIQSYRVTGLQSSEWTQLTRELRLVPTGGAENFGAAVCGNGIIDLGEECDPGPDHDQIDESCGDGTGAKKYCRKTDPDKCTWDITECATCNWDGDSDPCADDCYDYPLDDVRFTGMDCDAATIDCTKTEAEGGHSGCPQCSNHDIVDDLCGDGRDNDCNGVVDDGCTGAGDTGETYACDNLFDQNCPYVCNESSQIPNCVCGDDGSCNHACNNDTLTPPTCLGIIDPDCTPPASGCGYGGSCTSSADCAHLEEPHDFGHWYCNSNDCCQWQYTGGTCFVAGTSITMADGSRKPIEDVIIGDQVLSRNMETGELEPNEVLEISTPVHDDITHLVFEDSENRNTFDHPYYVVGKGWASYRPEWTKERYGLEVAQLDEGDIVYYLDEEGIMHETELRSIEEEWGAVQTYNLFRVEHNNNFFANGILVHNKAPEYMLP